jgi:pimeloyl-ACP methyl ester carboxylesterase
LSSPLKRVVGFFVKRAYAAIGVHSDVELTPERMAVHMSWAARIDFAAQRRAATAVRCPTLLIAANDDPIVEPLVSRELLAAFHAGVVTSTFVDVGGHFLQRHEAPRIAAWLAATVRGDDA